MLLILPRKVGGGGVGVALAEIVGFIATEVEAGGGKAREEFIEDTPQQILRGGVAGVERGAAQPLEPRGGDPRGRGEFHLGEVAVGGQRKDAPQMPEAGERGRELDEVLAAEHIQRAQVGGVVGVAIAGDVRIELEAEGVLKI